MKEVKVSSKLEQILRHACDHLLSLFTREFDLYHRFFSPRIPSPDLRILLMGFSTTFYDYLRPVIVRCHDISLLCRLVGILKNLDDVGGEEVGENGGGAETRSIESVDAKKHGFDAFEPVRRRCVLCAVCV